MATSLPGGRNGRLLALGLTAAVLLLTWAAAIGPLLEWHTDRLERLRAQEGLVARMTVLAATVPVLEREVASAPANDAAQPAPLEGATDALAAAALQEKLDELAAEAGLRFASTEALPAEPAGAEFRAIRLRVSVSAPWAAIVTLLHDAAAAPTPLVVDDLQLRGTVRATGAVNEGPLDAVFTVSALRRTGTAP